MLPKSQGQTPPRPLVLVLGSPKVTVETGPASPHPHLLRSCGWTMATCTKAFCVHREHRRVVAPAEAALDLSPAMTVQATYLLVDVLIICLPTFECTTAVALLPKTLLALQRCY